jgi:Zn-dependent metalloprotease
MTCTCHIIPEEVLARLANDQRLNANDQLAFRNSAALEPYWRQLRASNMEMTSIAGLSIAGAGLTVTTPSVTVFNCNHGTVLPGTPVPNPGNSSDATAKRTYKETKAVALFYKKVFNRNSINNQGMTLQSSIHFGVNYNNAFWNGAQMTYGDGDGNIFVDFTRSNDVIGHELTHGVTQFSSQFVYANESGGLNESMSDVFGSMFRQWEASQKVNHADWLIGKGIMGPGAIALGYTCLRDLANPAAAHCLAPQPTHFSQYHPGMDPHQSSGIPNFAFYKAAMAIGGKSWERTGQIWYRALTGFPPNPNMTMKAFADRTRTLAQLMYPTKPAIKAAVHSAWAAVGL